jgi:short-subunit dehydrogenase
MAQARFRGLAAAAAAGAAAAVLRGTRRPADDLDGEVALVTGASRGLGLLLARELGRNGCPLVLCARDGAELERAAGRLRADGAQLITVTGDITDEGMAQQLVDAAVKQYGRLDILVNNAGIIQVGPVESTGPAQYEAALAAMAMAPVRLALTALPVMQQQAHGRIVTIASIGGKVSVPHLLPYSTAKFAAVGFSEGLRAELGAGPVTVTTVVPGLMRTGSHLQAQFTGNQDEEFTWFALGASLPLVSMDAERAAAQIIAAVRERRPEIILTPAGQLAARAAGVWPGLTAAVLHVAAQVGLPAPDGNQDAAPGRSLRPAISPAAFRRLTALGRHAARALNEAAAGNGSRP